MKKLNIFLGLTSLAALTTTSVFALADFSHYTKKEWKKGYCYEFLINNTTNEDITDWNITFDLQDTIKSTWSGVFDNQGTSYTVTGVDFNTIIKPGQDTNIGFCARGSKLKPQNINFNSNNTPTENIIFESSFLSDWENTWGLETTRKWGIFNTSVVNTDTLKVFYPAGSYKPSADPVGGAGFLKKFTPGNDITLSYDVKFDPNFDFVKGGKLPGLCGGDCPTGSGPRDNGFSTRFMWRTAGDLEIYAYIADKLEGYGTSLGRGADSVHVDRWYTLSQRIVLNTPGVADGTIEYFVDGVKVYSKTDATIRSNPNVQIDGILFSTFFGGGDTTWATPVDTNSYFKNFKIVAN